MPHLHLSVQSGDDLILKRMRRRHSRGDVIEFCCRARAARPDIVFGADLIAGFPTESEDMFQRTLDLVGECGLTWLHVFPYSQRPDTPAARMPQVPMADRRERAARLREAGDTAERGFLESCIGTTANVLAERSGEGRTEHYARTRLASSTGTPITTVDGQIAPARVVSVDERTLTATPIDRTAA